MADLTVPTSGADDIAHAAIKLGFSHIPGVGGVLAEVFGMLVAAPLEKRKERWMTSVVQKLGELDKREQLNIEELPNNPSFVSAVTQASSAVLRTHQEEKLEAFRNAVLNSALPNAPSDTYQQLFIRWIDELTVDHIKFLVLFRDPLEWFRRHEVKPPEFAISSNLTAVLETAYPEMKANPELARLIATDLESRQLFSGSLSGMMSANAAFARRTTPIADRFVEFISDPSTRANT